MSLPLPLDPGAFIGGQYTIEKLINSGGFGAVYRGIDTSEGNRPCAIKETYDVTPAARRQALTEASILFTIKSKHLPQVYDAFEANGRFYLVMQLIEGQNLQQLLTLRGQPFDERDVLDWFLPIMDVLQDLHSRTTPIIHRDIKPANIILASGGGNTGSYAVLVDFGITKLYEQSGHTQTMAKAISEGFSSVEQYIGTTTPQSDIYSLAATMYTLLTNTVPPASINRSFQETLIPPRQLNPALSPKVERVVLKAMAVRPEERYRNMGEFAQALRDPGFTGYADSTVAAPQVQGFSQSPQASMSSAAYSQPAPGIYRALPFPHSAPNSYRNAPAGPYTPSSRPAGQSYPVQNQRNTPVVPPQSSPYQSVSHQSSPYQPAPYQQYAAPMHQSSPYGAAAPAAPVIVQPVINPPGAFGQGCLWGLVQGIGAALLLLFLKKDAYFYLGIFTGLLFYVIAGFTTTRKGGSGWRGGWAGFWAGIFSTLFYWVTMGIGMVILVVQKIQADTRLAQSRGTVLPTNEVQRAWLAMLPAIFRRSVSTTYSSASAQSPWTPLVMAVVGGLIMAIVLGWIGGALGYMSFKAKIQRQAHP